MDVLAPLGPLLALVSSPPRTLTYRQAETLTGHLAARLVAHFGRREVRQFRYTAIPRGGFIVLGMLAYLLDLERDRLRVSTADAPLVVVDDCSLTGHRLAEFLQSNDSPQVVFAHLYSHPDLRAAILGQEPRVVACLAAADLRDLAPEVYPNEEEYRAWQDCWRERFKEQRHWIGLPEQVIFPWSEPDRPYWSPATEQVEDNWRLAAPDCCLKNWARLGLPPRADPIPSWRSPNHVAYNLTDDQVTLCNSQTEQVYGLDGVAADMWRALAAYGDPEVVVQHLLAQYDVDEATLNNDLHAFVQTLLAEGLLEPVSELDHA